MPVAEHFEQVLIGAPESLARGINYRLVFEVSPGTLDPGAVRVRAELRAYDVLASLNRLPSAVSAALVYRLVDTLAGLSAGTERIDHLP